MASVLLTTHSFVRDELFSYGEGNPKWKVLSSLSCRLTPDRAASPAHQMLCPAHFPVVLKINESIRAKDPIILHCNVIRGQLHLGTPILVQGTTITVGKVIGMEKDKKEVKVGKKGMDVAVKIHSSDSNLTFGRQFDEKATLVSVVTRKAIDALKESFRSEMDDDDWLLIKKLAIEQGVSVGGKKKKVAPKEGAPAEAEEEGAEAEE